MTAGETALNPVGGMTVKVYKIYVGLTSGYNGRTYSRKVGREAAREALKLADIVGATLLDAVGVWEGNAEKSLVIEVLDTGDAYRHGLPDLATRVWRVADSLKKRLGQNSVLLTEQEVAVKFV